jgi:hypothetical protein
MRTTGTHQLSNLKKMESGGGEHRIPLRSPLGKQVVAIVVALAMVIGMMPGFASSSYADGDSDIDIFKEFEKILDKGEVRLDMKDPVTNQHLPQSQQVLMKFNINQYINTGALELAFSNISAKNSPSVLKTCEKMSKQLDDNSLDEQAKSILPAYKRMFSLAQKASFDGALDTNAYKSAAYLLKLINENGNLNTIVFSSTIDVPLETVLYYENASNFNKDQIAAIKKITFGLELPNTPNAKRFAEALAKLSATGVTLTDKNTKEVVYETGNIRTPFTAINLTIGGKATLPLVIDNKSGNTKYKSDNKYVVTVSSKGKIKAKGCGKTIVSITNGNATKKITVNVIPKKAKLKKIKVTVKKSYKVGDKIQLKVKLNPKKAVYEKTTFKSNKKKIVSVDKAGQITALQKGKAKITIKVGKKKVTKTIRVI